MEQNDLNELDCLFNEDNETYFCDDDYTSGYEWTEEDAWDALTDGMYGDYPGGGAWDSICDIMGL